jgi:hypothetical protein
MKDLKRYAQLRRVLRDMEDDIGLSDYTVTEKNIISALAQLQSDKDSEEFVASKEIKAHKLCSDIPNPSFFRALKNLLSCGHLALPANRKKGLYRLEV